MSGIEIWKKRLFRLLKEISLQRGDFVLSSGKRSHIYIDARRVTLSTEGAWLAGKIIFELIKDQDIQAVGGPTLGADPIVGAILSISYRHNRLLQGFLIRKSPKSYGRRQQLEGPKLKRNANIVLIDDVATTGTSLLKAIRVLKKLSLKVKRIIVLVDRQEGAKELLWKEGYNLESIFKLEDFTDES